jgi:hypothetical protein
MKNNTNAIGIEARAINRPIRKKYTSGNFQSYACPKICPTVKYALLGQTVMTVVSDKSAGETPAMGEGVFKVAAVMGRFTDYEMGP